MHELLLCIGLFAVQETRNQDVLLWGKIPTPVHKLCSLSDSLLEQCDLISSLRRTLLAICISNQRVCEVRLVHQLAHLAWQRNLV